MSVKTGFIVKADGRFYEGLAALLASLNQWHPGVPILTIDCGLNSDQLDRVKHCGITEVISPSLSNFSVAEEMLDYYSPAIYGLLTCLDRLFPLSIHIDADAVVLGSLDHLMAAGRPGIAAVPDFPYLNLEFQIGNKPEAYQRVALVLPDVDLQSISFNGGVFALEREYFDSLMREPL